MMTKTVIAAFAALLLVAPVRAEDAKPAAAAQSPAMTYFKNLRDSLTKSAVQGERVQGRGAKVAAVRAKQQGTSLANPEEPTLKGDARAKQEKAAAAEDAEFAAAVDLILQGKNDEGLKALEAFKTKHPKSRNLDNVQEAIEKVKVIAAAPKAEAKKDAEKKAE